MADLMKALRNADAAGDSEAAQRIAAMIRKSKDTETENSIGENIVGSLENIASFASGAVAQPVAGISGIVQSLNPWADEGAGGEAVEGVSEAMTYTPKTDAGQSQQKAIGEFVKPVADAFGAVESYLGDNVLEITGSPALATIAYTLPTAALEAIGVKGLRGGKKAITPEDIGKAKDFTAKGLQYKSPYTTSKFDIPDSDKKAQLDKALAKGDNKRVAAMMEADPEYFKAMKDLDVKNEGLPSAAATNRQYQEVEQSLKKMPGSDLAKKEFDQVAELQSKADDLITEFGGRTDKSSLSRDLADKSRKSIDDLNNVAEVAYKDIADSIPRNTASPMGNIGEYMNNELSDLGGDISQLSTLEKRLLKMSENGATYHALDKIRKEVGATIGKKSDKYKSEDTAALKNIYSKLTEDQGAVAGNLGMSESWNAAKELVKKRKALEDNSIKMFGKELNDSFMPKIGAATKNLSKGEYKKFFELMNSVPKKDRQQVVISALNDAFTMGSRKEKSLSISGYSDWWKGMNRNPALKREFQKYLPKKLSKQLNSLGVISNRIREAQSAAPVGGQVMASGGVLNKVMNGLTNQLSRLPGIMGAAVGGLNDLNKSRKFDAVLNLLGDKDFVRNIESLASGHAKKAKAIELRLMKKKAFQEFVNTLPASEAKAISAIGLTSWLAEKGKEEPEK